ncbi:hypothetical protein K3169_07520 [Pseudomonas phytophila]|uniref:Immunity MXAN-0049 protein domain-containing protein n=1 Tax=Pseudomonas phytophila TaxID=2867264 RepID=A0ABY6FII0_9PSED|nr:MULTISPECIES: DUF1629 domain-containing protein [Pseudomonas]MCD5988865.1 hypothetical protein [Pseudomonas quasicaspiana]UXZ97723.1 hypothetical protein K3169_07520 [Pseudomonas phytophila]
MAKFSILKIFEYYPERYWFKHEMLAGQDSISLKTGMEITEELKIEFTLTSKVSVDALLKYDFFFSSGPNFISPRFHQLLLKAQVSGIQFLDADVFIAGKRYEGYKIFNVTSKHSVFDKEKSKSRPIVSYLPDGPKIYNEIVLRDDVELVVDVFRAEEDFTVVLVSERVRELCELNKVRGLQFIDRLS